MALNLNSTNDIAKELLQINAIKLQAANPFTWASGWKSPIYCDNRRALSYPATRSKIVDGLVDLIKNLYPEAKMIAGVATGAISWGCLVAEKLNLPMIYIRPEPKSHGLGNQIEGDILDKKGIVVVEDLISTGGSSIKACKALEAVDAEILGMVAIFTYGFQVSEDNFKNSGIKLDTLSNYNLLINNALEIGYIHENDVEILKEWRLDPSQWKK